jgi:hypothetical protein
MKRHIPKKIRIRVFVEERNHGMVWVPYKTLIGYTLPNRPIIGRLWEQLYGSDELPSRTEAIEKARRQACVRILELFGPVENANLEWEVIHERGPNLVAIANENGSVESVEIGTEAVAVGAMASWTADHAI